MTNPHSDLGWGMPELAEVEYYRKIWNAGIGKKITRVHVHPSARVFRGEPVAAFATALEGSTYKASTTHGKNMLFQFTRSIWLGGHLGMSGEMTLAGADYAPGKHDHLVLFTTKHALILTDPRMFGRWRIHQSKQPPPWWSELPPAVLSAEFTTARLAEALQRHARQPLKALLLDQTWFPGIGNWMADEILWRLKWHPARAAGGIKKAGITQLHQAVQDISRSALEIIGTDWSDPPAETWLITHRWRDGGFCPRCKGPLHREDLRGRTCCWCPKCQRK